MPPADGSPTRGGSTSVRGRVRSPHMAKLQAASVPKPKGSCAPRAGTDRRTDGSRYRLMFTYGGTACTSNQHASGTDRYVWYDFLLVYYCS